MAAATVLKLKTLTIIFFPVYLLHISDPPQSTSVLMRSTWNNEIVSLQREPLEEQQIIHLSRVSQGFRWECLCKVIEQQSQEQLGNLPVCKDRSCTPVRRHLICPENRLWILCTALRRVPSALSPAVDTPGQSHPWHATCSASPGARSLSSLGNRKYHQICATPQRKSHFLIHIILTQQQLWGGPASVSSQRYS